MIQTGTLAAAVVALAATAAGILAGEGAGRQPSKEERSANTSFPYPRSAAIRALRWDEEIIRIGNNAGDNWRHSRLAWSKDGGKRWTWADWHFSGTFGCPDFIQFGMNYHGARDGSVYVLSQDNESAYGFSPHIVLARVPRQEVPDRERYEFFTGLGGGNYAFCVRQATLEVAARTMVE